MYLFISFLASLEAKYSAVFLAVYFSASSIPFSAAIFSTSVLIPFLTNCLPTNPDNPPATVPPGPATDPANAPAPDAAKASRMLAPPIPT